MGDIIEFPNLDNIAIEIERTEEFIKIANELGDFIKSLPLSHEENDELIRLMVKQVNVAETSAFIQGFAMGYEFGGLELEKR